MYRNNGKYHPVCTYSRSFGYTINSHVTAAIKSSISFAFFCFRDVDDNHPVDIERNEKYCDINYQSRLSVMIQVY